MLSLARWTIPTSITVAVTFKPATAIGILETTVSLVRYAVSLTMSAIRIGTTIT